MDRPEPAGRILVVDDNLQARELLRAALTAEGYAVTLAEGGEEALAKVAEEVPELILLDINMPGLNGYEVCGRLKGTEATRLIPIIFLTSMSDLEDKLRGIEVGADDFLTKPFRKVELLARVKSLLRVKRLNDRLENAENVLFALANAIEAKDPYTEGHIFRVATLALKLGRRLGLSAEHQESLWKGGILHDIGKIGVPDAILNKAGRLNPEEVAQMQIHAVVGERICQPLRSIRYLLPVIRHHHEKFNGTGYPDGLRGEAIPITARIVGIVDMYDALITDRPYRPRLTREEAFGILQSGAADGTLDAELVGSFISMIQEEEGLAPAGGAAARAGGATP
ncbi:MAG TPA: HD domain-containing phosphohydrolase [Candidatus Methylomirabilis sp.]|nr:HD domain-containing phosphohydrolase [Candidatus Methylomirabilis sp.]